MSKTLIIAEKPSVSREIAAALGGCRKTEDWLESADVVVSSAIGHLVEIYAPEAETAGRSLDSLPIIPTQFALQAISKTKGQFNVLRKLMKRADVTHVVNACDAGREGELIFRLIYELAGCRKPIQRMWLQSMTADAIRDAYRQLRPGSEFDALSDAARSRSEADWLMGINGTRAVTQLRKLQTKQYEMMNVGRVQTPTLAILVRREWEIRQFVPQDYWEVLATFRALAGTYVGKWFNPQQPNEGEAENNHASRFFDKTQAEQIVAKCQGIAPSSVTERSKTVLSKPPKLFDLTSLQREANKRFKFSAKKTLDLAQALYEKHKAISYPRTDAQALPSDYVEQAKTVLGSFSNEPYVPHATRVLNNNWVKPDKRIFDNSKITDHFAIIPTGAPVTNLDGDEQKIYDMVVRRFIAVFHPAAEYNLTTRISIIADEQFKSTGKVLIKQGWLEVYGQVLDDDQDKTPALCALTPDEQVHTIAVETKAGKTQAPARFTEASLLAAMEGAGKLVDDDELRAAMKERGLGTPATRAAIIEGLLYNKDSKGKAKEPYVVREGKAQHLVPTQKGLDLIQFLDSNDITALTSPRTTGEWEHKLRQIEQGQYTRAAFMGEIGDMTRKIIDIIRHKAGADTPAVQAICPQCQSQLRSETDAMYCTVCDFKLPLLVCSRPLSSQEANLLLRGATTGRLQGFVSPKSQTVFAAILSLDPASGRIKFQFDDPNTPTLTCPNCQGVIHEQDKTYSCEHGDFKLWKTIASRPLAPNEARVLIQDKYHPKLTGFTSKAGKPFSAALRLVGDKVEFVFE